MSIQNPTNTRAEAPLAPTVASPTVDLEVEYFEDDDVGLDPDEARDILQEIWRLSRNERMLEIEYEHRGYPIDKLQLDKIAEKHRGPEGEISPEVVAKTFTDNVRANFASFLCSGPRANHL